MSAPMFPILGNRGVGTVAYIPWPIVAPHERQAQKNHSQSLARLAERGGLSPVELAAVLRDQPYEERTDATAWAVIWRAASDYASGLAAADALAQACIKIDLNIGCAVCSNSIGFTEATPPEVPELIARLEHAPGCAIAAYLAARTAP